jgi:hypothetical protein
VVAIGRVAVLGAAVAAAAAATAAATSARRARECSSADRGLCPLAVSNAVMAIILSVGAASAVVIARQLTKASSARTSNAGVARKALLRGWAATRITVVVAVLVDSSGNVARAALDHSFASQSAFHLGLATSAWVLLLVISATPAVRRRAQAWLGMLDGVRVAFLLAGLPFVAGCLLSFVGGLVFQSSALTFSGMALVVPSALAMGLALLPDDGRAIRRVAAMLVAGAIFSITGIAGSVARRLDQCTSGSGSGSGSGADRGLCAWPAHAAVSPRTVPHRPAAAKLAKVFDISGNQPNRDGVVHFGHLTSFSRLCSTILAGLGAAPSSQPVTAPLAPAGAPTSVFSVASGNCRVTSGERTPRRPSPFLVSFAPRPCCGCLYLQIARRA